MRPLVLFILFCTGASAQTDTLSSPFPKRNTVNLEIRTNYGELIGFSFDRVLTKGKFLNAAIRVGSNIPYRGYLIIPGTALLLAGTGSHFFEGGLGGELIYEDLDLSTNYGALFLHLGYRYQPRKGGFSFRAGGQFIVGYANGYLFEEIPLCLAAGYSF